MEKIESESGILGEEVTAPAANVAIFILNVCPFLSFEGSKLEPFIRTLVGTHELAASANRLGGIATSTSITCMHFPLLDFEKSNADTATYPS
ncbi:hypothetical protein M5K25_000652 [Dendrobium thyrsiflorum]|uniref:Uncharacterized protein n=1 Tax=Dendrobium thyrsiflorum TaxID=117978 RepID=A0ABD0VW37_DENTH